MKEQKQVAHHFKLDADVSVWLKSYAKEKYRGNMTYAINEILAEKAKRVSK